MKAPNSLETALASEVSELRQRIAELESREHEHKQTEKELREAEGRLRIILESVQAGIVIIDSETHRIVDANPIASKLIGAPKGKIIGSLCHQYICTAEEGRCPITDLGQTVDNSERVLLTAGGERRSVIKTVVPVIIGDRKHLLESFFDITERKRAEEILREREERYRTLLQTMEEGYFEVDLKGNFTFVNDSLSKMFNASSKDELMGLNNKAYMNKETVRKVYNIFTQVHSTGQPVKLFEWEVTKKDGKKAIHESSVYLIRNAQGEPIGFRGILRDITDRNKAEEALREAEDRYRDLVENCHDLICTHDLEGNILWINPIPAKILGYERNTLLKMNIREILAPEVQKEFSGYLNQMKKDGRGKGLMVVQTARGERRIWEYNNTLREEGVATPLVRAIAHDITDRKQMEEALRKREVEAQRLAEENAIMAGIGQIISSTLNIDEIYENFSKEAKKLIPFDRIVISIIDTEKGTVRNVYHAGEGVPDRNTTEIYPLEGSGNAEMVRTNSTLLVQTEDFNEYKDRFPMLCSTFQAGFRSIMNVPLFANGKIIGGLLLRSRKPYAYTDKDLRIAERIGHQIAGTIANIQLFAELKQAEEGLRHSQEVLETKVRERTEDLLKAKDAAEAASRAKSDFLANMSHELRTPLNHIIGFTELVVDKQCGDLNEVQEDYLNDTLQSSRHLLSLINDILDLSKVEAGKLELEVTQIHLRELLEGSLGMVKEKAMKHRIQLLTDMDGIPEVIQADERKLKQILYNLLSNAVKFTPAGGSVVLSARYLSFRDGQWFTPDGQPVGLPLDKDDLVMKGKGLIDISVQDTGIGIKGEDLDRIFDPFEQVECSASRRYQGTGLGLSLARRLVELHGGRIWAESEGEGKGSKFILLIPVSTGTRHESMSEHPSPNPPTCFSLAQG